MDIYTLDDQFLKKDVIDEFESVIWTERYNDPGDVSLEVPATSKNITALRNGTFLSLVGTKEVMILETQSIEDGLLTVTGYSLLKFLNERILRFSVSHKDRVIQIVNPPKWIINTLVFSLCTNTPYSDGTIPNGLDGPREVIPNLTVGAPDIVGTTITVAASYGPLYDAIKTIADTYAIGMTLYLDTADIAGYVLRFDTYLGRNLTSAQSVHPIVRFSPAMDSLANVKELISISGYKSVAYAFAPLVPGGLGDPIGVAYADADSEMAMGFSRRSLMVLADDITDEALSGTSQLQGMLDQRARDGLANNNFTKVVDGEVVPQSEYKYGSNYSLGDVVELEGHSGVIQNARVTEYIRAQDATGEREYPTVSVVGDTD